MTLRDSLTGEVLETRARKIVDATGPWSRDPQPRLVRGSHLILPRFTARDHAIAYFEESGRILFLIPWGPKRDLTLLGTTDVDHTGGPDEVHISEDEVRYLLGIARTLYPGVPLGEPIATYSSLRPLLADGASSPTSATREHRIWNTPDGVLHITGGKYTTYRAMSEEAADLVAEEIAPELAKIHATAETPLSGRASAGVPQELELYGEQAEAVLRYLPEREPEGMTPLEAARLAYAVHHEMAQRLEDFLCASTYLGYERSWSEESLAPFRAEFLRHTQGAGA